MGIKVQESCESTRKKRKRRSFEVKQCQPSSTYRACSDCHLRTAGKRCGRSMMSGRRRVWGRKLAKAVGSFCGKPSSPLRLLPPNDDLLPANDRLLAPNDGLLPPNDRHRRFELPVTDLFASPQAAYAAPAPPAAGSVRGEPRRGQAWRNGGPQKNFTSQRLQNRILSVSSPNKSSFTYKYVRRKKMPR